MRMPPAQARHNRRGAAADAVQRLDGCVVAFGDHQRHEFIHREAPLLRPPMTYFAHVQSDIRLEHFN
jgi:hypothetical protein